MPSIKSTNLKKKIYTKSNKLKKGGSSNNNNNCNYNNRELQDFINKYIDEIDLLLSFYKYTHQWDLSILDKIINNESKDNLKYLRYIIKKLDLDMFKDFNKLYKKEFTLNPWKFKIVQI